MLQIHKNKIINMGIFNDVTNRIWRLFFSSCYQKSYDLQLTEYRLIVQTAMLELQEWRRNSTSVQVNTNGSLPYSIYPTSCSSLSEWCGRSYRLINGQPLLSWVGLCAGHSKLRRIVGRVWWLLGSSWESLKHAFLQVRDALLLAYHSRCDAKNT